MVTHEELIQHGKQILLERGFKETEIKEEYIIPLQNGIRYRRIDIVGENNILKIAIECGSCPRGIKELKPFFNEVIYLPYVIKNEKGYFCSKCNLQWTPRGNISKCCPKCKIYFRMEEENLDEM